MALPEGPRESDAGAEMDAIDEPVAVAGMENREEEEGCGESERATVPLSAAVGESWLVGEPSGLRA